MYSYLVWLDVLYLVGTIIYFRTLCKRAAKEPGMSRRVAWAFAARKFMRYIPKSYELT